MSTESCCDGQTVVDNHIKILDPFIRSYPVISGHSDAPRGDIDEASIWK